MISNCKQKSFPKIALLLTLLFANIVPGIGADKDARYGYHIDLNTLKKDRFQVELQCEGFSQDTLVFHIPWMIPGTYMEANYGRFVHDLSVYDKYNQAIRVKRKGKNTFIITPANNIQSIKYWVSATWDSRRPGTIWPMAGTGIQEDRMFAINAGGVFGYFHGQEQQAVDMVYEYPQQLHAMTVLSQSSTAPRQVFISASDYHELIDSPIMFAKPDTTSFNIHDTHVLVGFAHETDDTQRAVELAEALSPSMDAIGSYLDSLPVDKYAYLIYYYDASPLGKVLDNPRFILWKSLAYFIRHGVPMGGAWSTINHPFIICLIQAKDTRKAF